MYSATVMEQLEKLIFYGIEQNTMLRFSGITVHVSATAQVTCETAHQKHKFTTMPLFIYNVHFPRRSTLWPAKDKQPSILWTVTMGTAMARLLRHSLPACPEGAWSRDPGRGRGETTGNAADNWRWTTGKMQNEIPRAAAAGWICSHTRDAQCYFLHACLSAADSTLQYMSPYITWGLRCMISIQGNLPILQVHVHCTCTTVNLLWFIQDWKCSGLFDLLIKMLSWETFEMSAIILFYNYDSLHFHVFTYL